MNWLEEDREEIVSAIVDGMVSEMTFEQMRQMVWDLHYEDLIYQDWTDIWGFAETYAPDILPSDD